MSENGQTGVGTHLARAREMARGVKRNNLDRRQARQLEDHVNSQWDRIEQDRPMQPMFAEFASQALGFKVTTGNLVAAIHTLDKKWPTPRHATAGSAKKGSGALASLRKDVRTLAGSVRAMFDALGVPPPEELKEITDRLDILDKATEDVVRTKTAGRL